jgi:hypothetical protein
MENHVYSIEKRGSYALLHCDRHRLCNDPDDHNNSNTSHESQQTHVTKLVIHFNFFIINSNLCGFRTNVAAARRDSQYTEVLEASLVLTIG